MAVSKEIITLFFYEIGCISFTKLTVIAKQKAEKISIYKSLV